MMTLADDVRRGISPRVEIPFNEKRDGGGDAKGVRVENYVFIFITQQENFFISQHT
jgi:hypothetical protein